MQLEGLGTRLSPSVIAYVVLNHPYKGLWKSMTDISGIGPKDVRTVMVRTRPWTIFVRSKYRLAPLHLSMAAIVLIIKLMYYYYASYVPLSYIEPGDLTHPSYYHALMKM